MTKRERAQVVELLRCAVEKDKNGAGGIFGSVMALYEPTAANSSDLTGKVRRLWMLACRARDAVGPWWSLHYDFQCLEAALRVEQGEWP
jgi:hypothetical protein